MPIIAFSPSSRPAVRQVCAFCKVERDHLIETLTLGTPRGDGTANEAVIMFPECACGASEGVFRLLNEPFDEDSRACLHGRAVLAVGECLKALGRVHPLCADAVAAEPAPRAAPVRQPVIIPPPW